ERLGRTRWARGPPEKPWARAAIWRSGAARASGEGNPGVFPSAALGSCLWSCSVEPVGPLRIFASRTAPTFCKSSRQPSGSRFEDRLVRDGALPTLRDYGTEPVTDKAT